MAVFSWLVVLSLLFLWFWKSRRPRGFPPGPWRLPLIGNLLQVSMGNLLKDLDQLAKKYGPVFSLYLGGTPAVFTHGFRSAKEVLVIKGTEFAGRADFPVLDIINKKKGMLTLRYGEVWKEQRRFSLMLLRHFGVGKKAMEEKILEEATYLIEAFTEKMSVPFDPHEFVDIAVANITFPIIFGKRFEYDSAFLKTLLEEIHQRSKMALGPWGLLYNAVPLVRRLPLPHQRILATSKKVEAFFEKEVEEHKATLVPGEPRDFTDAYLEEMQKAERKSSGFEDEQLRALLSDLFFSGTEIKSGTLLWGFLYLMAFPEIQEKCQKEIDAVLGNNARLKYEDRENFPYTNAVIHEIQRISNVAPLGIPHAPIQDVQLFGYKIPKLYNVMPLVRRLPLPHQRILTTSKKVEAFLEKEVEEHKATLVPGEPRDFTDAYLEEMQKAERKSSSFEDEQLRVLLCDLFLAGTETMSGTLLWGFLYLMAFPEIQEKCQKEIDAVLGNNASLKFEDRENLPYTNAVIHEIQRISNVAPLGLPHATIQDVQLFGYKIPKLYNAVPLVRRLPLPHQTILTTSKKVEDFIEKEVEEHKATLVPGEPRNFTDAYLEEMQKAERKSSGFEDEQLRALLSDLFFAGTEIKSGTLLWGFLYLMAFPEIQEKCWKEINTVLGNHASLKYEDRENLPYTNAVIHEIQRISNVAPLGIPHAPIQDVQLFGYKIPKDTMVFVNLQSAHFDESQWKFPDEFNPSNFLKEKGEFVKPEAFLAFSAGPRVCLGENLAQMELFLFFTSILRNFQLLWPVKSQAPDFTPQLGITQTPSHFKVLLKCRQPSE
ncbi:uncharacterized protein PHA67_002446 [Liasis olivaceus]